MFEKLSAKIVTAVIVTAVAISVSAWAQESDVTAEEDAMFSSTVTTDDDALFSNSSGSDEEPAAGVLIVDLSEDLDSGLEYDGLETEAVRIGGNFEFTASDSWMWMEDPTDESWESPDITEDRFEFDLNAKLFFEARPDTDTKFYGSVEITGPLVTAEDDAATPMDESWNLDDILAIDELFADFNWNEDIFFRAGKQTVNSGVGYFYSPADLLSIGDIDVTEPEAVLEGPVALKASVPLGMNSLQFYAVADEEITSAAEVALVPLFDFVIGGTEIGVGVWYRSDKAPRATATVTTSIFDDESIFAEALVGYGTPTGLKLTDEDEFFAQLTGGVMYSNNIETDDEFSILSYTLTGQYLFNYGDADREALIAMPGDHYLTLMGSLSDIAETGLSLSTTWQTNLSDNSGILIGNLSYELFDGVDIKAGVNWMYGESGDEYGMKDAAGMDGIDAVTGTISASFGNGSF